MEWDVTGGSLVCSLVVAGVALVVLGLFFDNRRRTAVAAIVIAALVNLFVPGGSRHLVYTALRPLHAMETTHPPVAVEETPPPYPPNR